MKPSQGAGFVPKSIQMGITAQIFVLVGLAISTAVITRVVVLGSVSLSDEFQRLSFTPNCTSGSPLSGYGSYEKSLDTTFDNIHGYILSSVKTRYDYASGVLGKFNIIPHQYVPPSYKSKEVYNAMEQYHNSTRYHKDVKNLKMFSQRMAHTGMLHDFVNDQNAKINSWRFFFEDDIEIHPMVTPNMSKEFLVKGLQLGSGDGMIYLGICGPGASTEVAQLGYGVNARRTFGTCTHAYGVTKWRAAGILSHLDKLELPYADSRKGMMFYDLLMRTYGSSVTKAWVLGVNLRSPVPDVSHWGLIYQDRIKYPSFISAPPGAKDP